MKKLLAPITVSAVIAGLLSACAGADTAPVKTANKPNSLQASGLLAPTQGNTVQGTVVFKQEADGIRIIAEVSGLTRVGLHGFHIHEKGDCSAPDASSAGGHYNPHGVAHGKVGSHVHHAGDLPSLDADAQGNAKLNAVLTGITLTGEHTIVGRSLIVHADPDDYTSQPTGNAGPRVACAVIKQD
jgi:Cu-Zn family superoxide dismutase